MRGKWIFLRIYHDGLGSMFCKWNCKKELKFNFKSHLYSHQSEGNDSLDDNAVDPHSLSPRGDRDMPYITQSNVPNPLSRWGTNLKSCCGRQQLSVCIYYTHSICKLFYIFPSWSGHHWCMNQALVILQYKWIKIWVIMSHLLIFNMFASST